MEIRKKEKKTFPLLISKKENIEAIDFVSEENASQKKNLDIDLTVYTPMKTDRFEHNNSEVKENSNKTKTLATSVTFPLQYSDSIKKIIKSTTFEKYEKRKKSQNTKNSTSKLTKKIMHCDFLDSFKEQHKKIFKPRNFEKTHKSSYSYNEENKFFSNDENFCIDNFDNFNHFLNEGESIQQNDTKRKIIKIKGNNKNSDPENNHKEKSYDDQIKIIKKRDIQRFRTLLGTSCYCKSPIVRMVDSITKDTDEQLNIINENSKRNGVGCKSTASSMRNIKIEPNILKKYKYTKKFQLRNSDLNSMKSIETPKISLMKKTFDVLQSSSNTHNNFNFFGKGGGYDGMTETSPTFGKKFKTIYLIFPVLR